MSAGTFCSLCFWKTGDPARHTREQHPGIDRIEFRTHRDSPEFSISISRVENGMEIFVRLFNPETGESL